jgi:uncharacterized SAM-binding protein YcdF (DUF218 family)
MSTLLLPLSLLPLGWVLLAAWLDGRGRRPPPAGNYEAIIVAGCRVDAEGRPSMALARRVRLATELHAAGVAPLLVLTGGTSGGPRPEAEAAAELARELGVLDSALLIETRSANTAGNAREAARLLAPYNINNVLVVSCSWHVWRCEQHFGQHFAAVTGTGTQGPWTGRARNALREALGVLLYRALGRL